LPDRVLQGKAGRVLVYGYFAQSIHWSAIENVQFFQMKMYTFYRSKLSSRDNCEGLVAVSLFGNNQMING
jgi:hypothetical protein